ncbi:hypothetical protein Leryth_024027 [Lithospermum erythrorhizon]|nr:hypothetical protein Leryth_024027 [Lithospermum erythrorhizon]
MSHNVKGRLRISQATLGTGSGTLKNLVQCNVGKNSPVLLCVLVPDKVESCHLDLEFDEPHNVVFSVIGSRSVYLTGYYLCTSHHQSDSESYGEDIADSDGLDRCSDEVEDEYEDSFIDDDEDDARLVSSQSTEIETSMENIPKDRNLKLSRRKKRYQIIDSDDEINSEASEHEDNVILSGSKSKNSDKNIAVEDCDKPKVNFGDGMKNANDIIDDSDDEVIFSFSAFEKKISNETEAGKQSNKSTVNFGGEVKNAYNQSCEHQPYIVDATNDQISEIDAVTCEKPTMKRKERSEDVKNLVTCISMNKEVKEEHPEEKFDYVNEDPHKNIKEQNRTNEMEIDSHSADMGSAKSKKRRKKSEKISVGGNNPECEAFKREGGGCPGNTDVPTKIDEIQPPKSNNVSDEKKLDQPAIASTSESKIKMKKKKKKNSTTEDNGEYTCMVRNVTEKPDNDVELFSDPDLENKNAELKTASTLSNGMIILELSKGKLDGKVAATGKKVRIQYTAMLKENGQVIDSNVAKSAYKFRLGKKGAIEGLHLGINGMRVGDKRKLIIPPSMGYGSQGAGENVPPNSWLVYEVELLGVSR